MELNQAHLAERLREAREAAGFRQEDAARHLGVSRSSIAQIELGNRSVSGIELARLAQLYGRAIEDFLAAGFDPGETALALFRRVSPEIGGQEQALEAIRECLQLSRELASLESILSVDRSQFGAPVYSVDPPRSRWQAVEQGSHTATAERRRLSLGDRPLWNASELLDSQGIRTAMLDLPEEVSGLTLLEKGLNSVVINRRHHRLRRRFSWIHEYAHVLLDWNQRGTISLESHRDDLAEVRANAFAAGFLLPEEGIRNYLADLGRGPVSRERVEIFDEAEAVSAEVRPQPGARAVGLYEVVLLSHHFQVSRIAALYRLLNLRILSPSAFEELLAEEKAGRGKRIEDLLRLPQPDHADARDEFRLRFLGLAMEAYRREKITRAKLRELGRLVGYDGATLDNLVENAGLDGEGEAPLLPVGLE